jgi:site-specific DNA-methyltransferase (adenine-specific)
MAIFIPISSITIGPRQRKKIESQPLVDLEESIRQHGILHPPVYRKLPGENGDIWQLLVGERRTRAMQRLVEKKIPFTCAGVPVPEGQMPITEMVVILTKADARQIEFDENKVREPLTWQEEAEALAEIHKLRQEENPKQTYQDTAKQLISEGVADTFTVPQKLGQKIQQSIAITENLSNPTISKARNATEAYNLLLKAEEDKINSTLAKRRVAASETVPSITLRKGSCLEILPTLEAGIADLILTDPPFGIGADTGGFRQRTVHHHNYEDTPDVARAIAQAIILDGFRVAKPMANLFIFCDIDLFSTLRDMAGRVGWVPFRTPIIWQKSLSEGMAPWQGKGFRRTYELIFWATKGQRGLISSPVDILTVPRVLKGERVHAAQKPVDLLKRLIECSTLPGDFVLDPCCGSGSTLVAARDLKRTGLGIELDDTFYNTAMANVHKQEEKPDVVEDLA